MSLHPFTLLHRIRARILTKNQVHFHMRKYNSMEQKQCSLYTYLCLFLYTFVIGKQDVKANQIRWLDFSEFYTPFSSPFCGNFFVVAISLFLKGNKIAMILNFFSENRTIIKRKKERKRTKSNTCFDIAIYGLAVLADIIFYFALIFFIL